MALCFVGCVGRLPGVDDGAASDAGIDAGLDATEDGGAGPDGGDLPDGGVDAGDDVDAGLDAGPSDGGTMNDADAGPPTGMPVFVNSWGGYGTDPGEFIEPSSVDLDENGVVIVAGHENRVQRFTMAGEPLEIWGTAGSGDGQFNHPHGLAVDDDLDLVYVGDQENHRLQVFTLSGAFVRQWGDAQFVHIHDIGIDRATGDVFVGDYEGHTVRRFSNTGALLQTIGGDGELNGVWGIDTDSNRNVYVADTHNRRVHKLAVDGTFLAVWQGFIKPTGIFVDVDDVVYVCDSLVATIYLFSVDGALLESWDLDQIYGEPSEPEDIVITPDGHDIFIGEVSRHRVLHLVRD